MWYMQNECLMACSRALAKIESGEFKDFSIGPIVKLMALCLKHVKGLGNPQYSNLLSDYPKKVLKYVSPFHRDETNAFDCTELVTVLSYLEPVFFFNTYSLFNFLFNTENNFEILRIDHWDREVSLPPRRYWRGLYR